MVKNNKKGISPVVATALLLVVAVVAVVGFQTWFNNYQSGLNSKVEQQSANGASLTVERVEGLTNVSVYIRNIATSAISINSWKITSGATTYCTGTSATAVASGLTTLTNTSCGTTLVTGNAYDVALVTASGVFSGNVIAR